MVGIFWTRGGGNGRRTDVCRLLLLNRDAYPGMRQSCLTRAGEQVADFLLPENSYLRGVSGFNESTVVPFFPPSIRIPDKLGKIRNYLSSFPIFYDKCRCEEGGAFSKDNKIGQKEYFRAPLLHISNWSKFDTLFKFAADTYTYGENLYTRRCRTFSRAPWEFANGK